MGRIKKPMVFLSIIIHPLLIYNLLFIGLTKVTTFAVMPPTFVDKLYINFISILPRSKM